MKTRIFTLIMSLFIATMAFAYDAQIDGIYYNFDQENKTAMVTNAGNVGGSDGNSAGYTQSEIIIPEKVSYNGAVYTVASIGDLAFYDCSYLTSITIPNSVTEVGGGVFYGCENLEYVVLSENVTSLPMRIVRECHGAYNYYYYYGFFGRCSSLTSITIPNSVTSIGDLAFSGCSSLTSIIIPNSVTEVGGGVFCSCKNLKSVVLSENVTSLPYHEYKEWNGSFYYYGFFEGCSSLTSITIPNSVISIGDRAFFNCSSLTSVQWNVTKCNDFNYDSRPFNGCEQITSFTFGDNVEYIPAYLCSGMSGLSSITIPNSVTEIGNNAFDGCSSLTSITIPNSVTEFGYDILYDCNNIQILNAPAQIFNQVTEEIQTQFSNKLTEVHITDGELDENGFNYINRSKKSLHTIDLAGTTNTVINDLAFYDCYKLENLMLPGNLETIGFKAFADCVQLKAIKFPSTLKAIQDLSFANCTKIDTIQVDAIVPPIITSTSFDKVSRDIEFIVPEEAREAYAEHEYWKEFMHGVSVNVGNVFENINIYTQNGILYFEGLNADYQVFDVNSRLVYTGRDTQLQLPRGVYVIAVGGEVEKVVL